MGLLKRLETVELMVDGMTCGGCAGRVEKALLEVPGVKQAAVDLDARRAVVNHKGADIPRLLAAVQQAGYEAQLQGNPAA